MLNGLSIRDFVLIDRVDIAFKPGLTVLTGETGAGKSILLDALSLALGARSEGGAIRKGAAQLAVTAEFDPSPHAVAILAEQGLEDEDRLLLRRVVAEDGRSRAFVNDQPGGVALLRRLGDGLVEIHGQFESHALLEPAAHRTALDGFAGLSERQAQVALGWEAWRHAAAARAAAQAQLARAEEGAELLRYSVEELTALDPHPGEEEVLADRRALLMGRARLAEAMNAAQAALSGRADVEESLRSAQRALARVAAQAQGRLDEPIAALDRALDETAEARALLDRVASDLDADPQALERDEERLFALRAAARKYRVDVTALPDLARELAGQLAALASGEEDVARLASAEAEARRAYLAVAGELGAARRRAAHELDERIAAELDPLKLRARFVTRVDALDEEEWGPAGADRVVFLVATNPGAEPGPIARVASGGELARLMLALRVVLAKAGAAGTLVFDEVDAGVGGAVAAAVGERLARLARDIQVLVVTHSPQVAARGDHHLMVTKSEAPDGTLSVRVIELDAAARREEIARMLAGARVTDQARAAADSLLAATG